MHDRDELVRKRAHQIWEDEGRPVGMEAAHWQRAREEIDSLARQGNSDFAADKRRSADPTPEDAPLTTTREAAAFVAASATGAKTSIPSARE